MSVEIISWNLDGSFWNVFRTFFVWDVTSSCQRSWFKLHLISFGYFLFRYLGCHPDCRVIDPFSNIYPVLDRLKIQQILVGLENLNSKSCNKIRGPHFLKVLFLKWYPCYAYIEKSTVKSLWLQSLIFSLSIVIASPVSLFLHSAVYFSEAMFSEALFWALSSH